MIKMVVKLPVQMALFAKFLQNIPNQTKVFNLLVTIKNSLQMSINVTVSPNFIENY